MNYNLMFSDGHVTIGTSANNIFDNTGPNKNSLHYKYNQFLISPYLERKYNSYNSNTQLENNKNNNINNIKQRIFEKDNFESFGETNIYYPKPNYYNNIYTQRFSKKYKKFYNNNNNYYNSLSRNNFRNEDQIYPYYKQYLNINPKNNKYRSEIITDKIKTPQYQIKKEIEIQKTPEKYNNYRRYDDYYFTTSKKEGKNFNPSKLSQFAENNYSNNRYTNNKNLFSSPFM